MTIAKDYSRTDIPRERAPEMFAVAGWAFIFASKEEDLPALESCVPWGRIRGIEADGQLVACHASSAYPLRVPGGRDVPAAGLMWVGVHQGHRRRGLLRAMVADHFERSLTRGEAVSTLFSAEPAIYQRFGYGLACSALELTLGRGVGLRELAAADGLRVELANADRARHTDAVLQVLRREGRPGTPMDVPDDMLADFFLDVEGWRNGAEPKRIALVYDDEGAAAFATFARKSAWGDGGPNAATSVRQWASATAAATHRLFGVVSDLDLTAETTVPNVAPDHPLLHLLVDPRAVKPRQSDNLWVRLLDVPKALESRGYAASADFTMRVSDEQLPVNARTWRISIDGGEATVSAVEAGADLEVSVQDLSAAYLGGVTLSELADAGLVTGDAGAIAAASAAFRGERAPVSAINF